MPRDIKEASLDTLFFFLSRSNISLLIKSGVISTPPQSGENIVTTNKDSIKLWGIDKEKSIVVEGYGIMQPRVGINLDVSYKSLFTKIFAGAGGIDNYTNAISDVYQDNFDEGIFTGKGIYDVEVFSKVLKQEITENTVLSHDL